MKFINRTKELEQLTDIERFSKKKLFTTLLFGHRRIGKTALIRKFITNKKHLYFFVYGNKTSKILLKEYEEELKKQKILEKNITLNTWDGFADILFKRCEDYIITFDEFQNFRKIEPSFYDILQRNIDENENKKIMFIFLGSIVGLIKKVFEDMQAPLYGRLKSKMNISPFTYTESKKLMRELKYANNNDFAEFYFVFGGIPKYYVMVEDYDLNKKDIFGVLDYLLLKENAPLQNEIPSILKQEFGSGKTNYYGILEAIAFGNTKLNDISTYTGLKPTDITPFLRDLTEHFEYVKRIVPITEDLRKSKKGLYKITNNFLIFWFRYFHKNISYYELGNYRYLRTKIKTEFNMFAGRHFEDICKQQIIEFNQKNELPVNFNKIGSWWHKQHEIDLVALNDETKDILFVECKWKTLKNTEAKTIIEDLKQKAKHVVWNNETRNEHFAIIAKKIKNKEQLKQTGIIAYDLDDF